jgi:putative addiction module component (TIGR02574 family)
MSALREQIANLTAAEKAELLDEVWQSLKAADRRQRAELDSRIERLEQNPAAVIPWEKVRSDLFKKTVKLPAVWMSEAAAELRQAGLGMTTFARTLLKTIEPTSFPT